MLAEAADEVRRVIAVRHDVNFVDTGLGVRSHLLHKCLAPIWISLEGPSHRTLFRIRS